MGKSGKRALFYFSSTEDAAARSWLESMANQGWELVKLKRGLLPWAFFQPLTQDGLRYDVDIADSFWKDIDRQAEYSRFLSDAGWDLVGCAGSLNVYKSRPGFSPAPIQTDPALARRRYWKEYLLPSLILIFIILALAGLLLAGMRPDRPLHLYHLFRSNALLAAFSLLAFSLMLTIGFLLWELWRGLRRFQADPPAPPPAVVRRARLRGAFLVAPTLLPLLAHLLVAVSSLQSVGAPWPSTEAVLSWPVVLMEDFGVDGLSPIGNISLDSVLLQGRWVRQPLHTGAEAGHLWEERFDCRYSWVADIVMDGQLEDGPSFLPVDWGFDESYLDGENRLLLRQGNSVLRLDAPFDLTTATALDILEACLSREG